MYFCGKKNVRWRRAGTRNTVILNTSSMAAPARAPLGALHLNAEQLPSPPKLRAPGGAWSGGAAAPAPAPALGAWPGAAAPAPRRAPPAPPSTTTSPASALSESADIGDSASALGGALLCAPPRAPEIWQVFDAIAACEPHDEERLIEDVRRLLASGAISVNSTDAVRRPGRVGAGGARGRRVVTPPPPPIVSPQDRSTMLILASTFDLFKLVAFLISRGADINAANKVRSGARVGACGAPALTFPAPAPPPRLTSGQLDGGICGGGPRAPALAAPAAERAEAEAGSAHCRHGEQ
jgi:hypothetical protein